MWVGQIEALVGIRKELIDQRAPSMVVVQISCILIACKRESHASELFIFSMDGLGNTQKQRGVVFIYQVAMLLFIEDLIGMEWGCDT